MTARVLERPGNDVRETVVIVHGNVSSSWFFEPLMLALPSDVRALAIDLRGFGDSPASPRSVYRSTYEAPGFEPELEDVGVESMLTTATGAAHSVDPR